MGDLRACRITTRTVPERELESSGEDDGRNPTIKTNLETYI